MVEILKDRALMFSADDGFWIAVNDEGTGPYLTDGLFTLTEGENYTIVINGTKYTGEAVTATVTGMGEVVGIGNADALTGGAGNGEPYAAGFAPAGADASTFILAWFDTATAAEAYTVSLYEGVEEEEPDTPAEDVPKGANIVLYDRNGEPVTYEGIETVSFNTAEGDIATYTHGTATDEVAVTLDLSAGNQTVTPEGADFVKKVVIEKPDNLLPENIKRGVEIAGVAGDLIGEGVSKEVALSLADGDQTVEADPETLMSEVVIKKPETLLPENIAKDVEIAGVVGTLSLGESVPPSDINFYDYDGTIVAAWTLEELAAATELPENPTHEGLVSQGWNWTLADLKAANFPVEVGQMYITDDGKTRLYMSCVPHGHAAVSLYISQTVANGVTIDWGDGSATQTISGTGNVNISHIYADAGDYVISLMPVDDCSLGFGVGASSGGVLGAFSGANCVGVLALEKVEIGRGVTTLATYSFNGCRNLKSATIPKGVINIGPIVFYNTTGLRHLTYPDSVISFPAAGNALLQSLVFLESVSIPNIAGQYIMISSCYNLARLTIPPKMTQVRNGTITFSYRLARLTLPANVHTIGYQVGNGLYNLKEIHCKRTTPPTATDGVPFANLPDDCVIYVPKGCLSAYTSATNWKSLASYMQEEP